MTFEKTDIYIVAGTLFVACVSFFVIMLWQNRFPSVQTLTDIAGLFNSKGGLIMLLSAMWTLTLGTTVAFVIWIVVKGVDPNHAAVITLMGMLTSNAFGNVTGALFKTMTGEDPKYPPGANVQKTENVQVVTAEPKP